MRSRPPALQITETCVYKTVDDVKITIDVYIPSLPRVTDLSDDEKHPQVLFIHGGAWLGGDSEDYSRPLLQYFLDLGCVVSSMNYRLLPETSGSGQREDIRDVEPWLRDALPLMFPNLRIDRRHIIVVGASAGGRLALLTVGTKMLYFLC